MLLESILHETDLTLITKHVVRQSSFFSSSSLFFFHQLLTMNHNKLTINGGPSSLLILHDSYFLPNKDVKVYFVPRSGMCKCQKVNIFIYLIICLRKIHIFTSTWFHNFALNLHAFEFYRSEFKHFNFSWENKN